MFREISLICLGLVMNIPFGVLMGKPSEGMVFDDRYVPQLVYLLYVGQNAKLYATV